MKNSKFIFIVVIVLILINLVTYTVDETKQALVIQMGKPVRTVFDAGLHFKLPFPVQSVVFFEKRILDYDAAPTEILTRDKKNLVGRRSRYTFETSTKPPATSTSTPTFNHHLHNISPHITL